MKKTIQALEITIILIILFMGIIPAVSALDGTETQVTTNTFDQIDPAISWPYIVFTDSRNGNKDIYVYDLASETETDLTPGTPNDQYLDDVDGTRVVYTSVTSSGADIYLYDLATSLGTPLTTGGDQYSPAIEGDHVVWVGSSTGIRNIMLANISAWTLTKVTSDPAFVDVPRVDGDWVVWEELVGSWRQIRAYQISNGETLVVTTDAANHQRPDVSGDIIVWADDRNDNHDIYSYSLSTGITTQVTSSPGDEQYPRIQGSRVVWEDNRSGVTQIWTRDLDTSIEEAVSPSTHPQILTAIDDNQIVWTESRFGNFDIFLFTIETPNQPPVADAGPDQLITIVGSVVYLDGTTSYDIDGDLITYLWTIANKPAGSTAALSDPTSATPTFTVDVQGEYVINLVVTDLFGAQSNTDSVTVSFNNLKPVADAGDNQVISLGTLVTLDGSGSSDANGDPLTYLWSIESKPVGSIAELSGSSTVWPTLTADVAGTYIIKLVVNDGFIDSDPSTVTITATDTSSDVIDRARDAIDVINGLDDGVFKNPNMKNALTNKITAVIAMVEQGEYAEALDKLQNDILTKTDGCTLAGSPDKNDWIIDCPTQNEIYPVIRDLIDLIEEML